MRCIPLLAALAASLLPPLAYARDDVLDLDLEALLEIEVVSASKTLQPLSRTAAAISVVTAEQIRRSGARNVPEALRLVPGVHAARIDANRWAITARGFNGRYANKLLVLLDGRSLYTPLTSGVYWEVHDVPLEEIERIEVIRGPGASLWGANAVNGVINIITRASDETVGQRASVNAGSDGSLRAYGRHGWVGDAGSGRV